MCNVKVEEGSRFNNGAGFYGKRIVWLLMQEYPTGLNIPEGLNYIIDTIGWAQVMATSSAKERLANIKRYDYHFLWKRPLRISNLDLFLCRNNLQHVGQRRILSANIKQLSISEITSNSDIVALQIKRLFLVRNCDSCAKIKSLQYLYILFRPLTIESICDWYHNIKD